MKLLYFPSEKDPCPNTVIEAILSDLNRLGNFVVQFVFPVRQAKPG